MIATDASIIRGLLGCLGGQAWPGDALDGVDSQRVIALARHHRLAALLGAARPDGVPPALAEAFRHDHLVTLSRNTILRHVLRECLSRFDQRGIDVVLLKGLAYEETLYPRAGMRQTSDLDLLVEPRFRRTAFAALLEAGFTPVAAAPGFDELDYHEVEWKRAEVYVDLHFALAPFERCAIDYEALWAEKRPLPLDGAAAWQLAAPHAAVFHALHMAIHHFDVPSLYLVDMRHLVPDEAGRQAAEAVARAWRCHRPWRTSLALTGSFVSGWELAEATAVGAGGVAARVIAAFGGAVPRAEQLRRKIEHFDSGADAIRYIWVQGRRVLREQALRRFSDRSPEERLGLARRG